MSEENYTEPAEKSSSSLPTVLLVVGGIAVVLILICCVIFAMLAILGPQIGNVFSQITYELENPTAAVVHWSQAFVLLK